VAPASRFLDRAGEIRHKRRYSLPQRRALCRRIL
jgi:hypothetical protein